MAEEAEKRPRGRPKAEDPIRDFMIGLPASLIARLRAILPAGKARQDILREAVAAAVDLAEKGEAVSRRNLLTAVRKARSRSP